MRMSVATKLTDMGKHLGATAIEQLVLSGILIKQAPKPPPRTIQDKGALGGMWFSVEEGEKYKTATTEEVDLNGVYNDDPTSED